MKMFLDGDDASFLTSLLAEDVSAEDGMGLTATRTREWEEARVGERFKKNNEEESRLLTRVDTTSVFRLPSLFKLGFRIFKISRYSRGGHE